MTNKSPFIREIPIYGQFSNGCGLSSLLMLVNPEGNPQIKEFLETHWSLIKPLFEGLEYRSDEYRWSLCLQYLLLKCVAFSEEVEKEKLYAFFNERMNWAFEDVRFLNSNDQQIQQQGLVDREKYNEANTYIHYLEGNDLLTPIILTKNIHVMKKDMELRVLAEIFNYEFIYLQYDDITGSITFLSEELRKKNITNTRTKEKWKALEQYSNDPQYLILYGRAHHWLAVRGIYRLHQLELDSMDEKSSQNDTQNPQNTNNNLEKENNSSIDKITNDKSQGTKNKNKNKDKNSKKKAKEEINKWKSLSMMIDVNDPASKRRVHMDYRQITINDRFLVFKKRENEDYSIFNDIIRYAENDMLLETEIWSQYLEKRKIEEAKNKKREVEAEIKNTIKDREEKIVEASKEKDNIAFLKMIDDDEENTQKSKK